MKLIRDLVFYIIGLLFVHVLLFFDFCQIIPMILIMACKLNEKMSELIYIYIGGGLIIYLLSCLVLSKRIDRLFKLCWSIIGLAIIFGWSDSCYARLDSFLAKSLAGSLYNMYYIHHYASDTFTLIVLYILSQLAAILLYLLLKLIIPYFHKASLYKYLCDNKQRVILTVKCIVSYLVGLVVIHFIPSGREHYLRLLELMSELVGNGSIGQCLLFYVMGSAFTYLSYNLLVRKKLPSLFFKCWFAGLFLMIFASVFLVPIDNCLSASCLNGLVERYNRLHDGGHLLTVFSYYILCQLFVLSLYRFLKSKE